MLFYVWVNKSYILRSENIFWKLLDYIYWVIVRFIDNINIWNWNIIIWWVYLYCCVD